ncbi:MAG: hypothetical protein KAS71_01640 [Bacteroidales bacterium]|nr:hypothetical protein [Bacteroidales bacterium]
MPDFNHLLREPLLILLLLLFAGLLPEGNLMAQIENRNLDSIIIERDTVLEISDTVFQDPQKAALYSALLPGLGQIYNRKIWKVPVIYVGFGTFIYYVDRNQRYYLDLKNKLMDPLYELKYFVGDFTEEQLTTGKDIYKRWRDMSILGSVGFYVLQILDATVDAYLFNWDVDEDISLKIEPVNIPGPFIDNHYLGLRASLSF